ncbi:MAG TPA: alpha-L-rhamnosidase N-terminal domain-containing protein [Candidatus Merdivicinus intestinigallinarum]|nr:alpha-L-rhamnosidase N-terminal domain-containing protein [Candidatus Merdivicinus intestinigallinarum]
MRFCTMNITRMKTNHLTNPLGYLMDRPTFTWTARSDGLMPVSARVEIAADADFSHILFDSGEKAEISGLGYTPDFIPEAKTRYFWRVSVKADNGDCGVSEAAWFETAMAPDGWKGEWITPPFDKEKCPIFQKTFAADGKKPARLTICGLGVYEAYLNGKKLGEEYLLPGFHAYDFWQQYQTFDLDGLLQPGENVLSVLLGNGWYKGRFGFEGNEGERYGSRFLLIAQVEEAGNILTATDPG